MKTFTKNILAGLAISAVAFSDLTQSAIAETTAWYDLGGGRARMVSVFDPVSGQVEGIIDVELLPNWTTYWRNPGEAGIPPIFDFSKSTGVTVSPHEFPVPIAKNISGSISVVYLDHVAFPFTATPIISPLSGQLSVEILMGVCEVVCIPAVASFTQDLSKLNKSDPVSHSLINLAKRKVPIRDAGDGDWPRILDAKLQNENTVIIRARIPRAIKTPQLFAEGKDNWFFSPAKLISREGIRAEFELSLIDLPEGADLSQTALRLTLTAGDIGSERTIIVDK